MPGITKMEDISGSLAHSYKSTLMTMHLLLFQLNRLETEGKLPANGALTDRITGAIVAMRLGLLHFPDLHDVLLKEEWAK